MADQRQRLGLDAKLQAEDELYRSMFERREDNKILWIALGLAVFVHLGVLMIKFPEWKTILPQDEKKVIVVRKYVPPPPPVERKQIVQQKITRKVPIPDPTPDEPEPIREPEPEILEPAPLPPDAEVLLGDPEPPPPSGPLLAGVGDVTNPVRIEATYVKPEYPDLARQARLEGNVILQAVVTKDGTVQDVKVLRVDKPNLGFETAAVEAVKQWRYKPAMQNGRPVDVYFTINVSFTLH